jgi:uncharacterized protein DUF4214
MKVRTAIMTGITGLMLSAGFVSGVSAQPAYRYRPWRYNQMRYGTSNEWQAQQMIRQAYRDILQREPDPGGLQTYMDNVMNRGWTEADVRNSMLQSPEYAQRFGYGARPYGYRYYRYNR